MQCQFIILHYNASYMVLRSCSGSLLWSCQNLLGDTVWGGDKFQQVWDIHKIRWRASQQESTTNNSWPCDVLFCKDSECRMFELSNLLPAFMGAPRWDLQNSNFLLLRKSVNSATVKELHTKACQWIQVCIKADSSRASVALSHTRDMFRGRCVFSDWIWNVLLDSHCTVAEKRACFIRASCMFRGRHRLRWDTGLQFPATSAKHRCEEFEKWVMTASFVPNRSESSCMIS